MPRPAFGTGKAVPPASRGEAASQTTRALLSLRELILSGEYAPGERLSELPLVSRLGVSRTPLRMALASLRHEGLLEAMPAGGYAVREFTPADIDDAIELRGVLEGTAARFAAERGLGRRTLAGLRVCCEQMESVVHDGNGHVPSFLHYVGLNERFHALLVEAAGSAVLKRAIDNVMSLPFASPSAFLLAQADLPESRQILVIAQHHHRAVVEAIERREGARAEGIGREHARLARRNLEVALEHRAVLDQVPGASLLRLPEEADSTRGEEEQVRAL